MKDLTFSLQTITTSAVGSLRSIQPDTEGIYRGVPLTVIGMPSRNNMLYDPQSLVHAMTNPQSKFYKDLTGGSLNGEYGHPVLVGLAKQDALKRLSIIVETQVSHQIVALDATQRTSDGKYIIVKGDIKPFGPYAKHLCDSFADKHHDTCFSLRNLTSMPKRGNDGLFHKTVVAMITYDHVTSAPGYEIASKRAMTVGTESMECVSVEENVEVFTMGDVQIGDQAFQETIGYESIRCQEVLDLLERDEVKVCVNDTPVGFFDSSKGVIVGGTGHRSRSVFHEVAKGLD